MGNKLVSNNSGYSIWNYIKNDVRRYEKNADIWEQTPYLLYIYNKILLLRFYFTIFELQSKPSWFWKAKHYCYGNTNEMVSTYMLGTAVVAFPLYQHHAQMLQVLYTETLLGISSYSFALQA
jgi:hypothetical protein